MAFYSREPLGEAREDLRMAILASVIANVNRDSGRRAYEAKDFLPQFWTSGMTVSEKALAIFKMFKAS